ncbi:MAG: Uma2 family endonuclease [Fimbriiglobus sp.]
MSTATPPVVYPDSDGRPIADNPLQFRWIVTLKGNLDAMFADRYDVFVAGDHLIYAQTGNPKRRVAPDVYVAIGRPKGDRGSYKVWEEGGLFPQVVFEVRSPGNRAGKMAKKLAFYDRYGAEEYYDLDPDNQRLRAYIRIGGQLDEVEVGPLFVSPLLGIRFDQTRPEVVVRYPNGRPFLGFDEVIALRDDAERHARDAERHARDAEQQARDAVRHARDAERQAREAERRARDAERHARDAQQQAAAESSRADAAEVKAAALAARLRELGLDPDAG